MKPLAKSNLADADAFTSGVDFMRCETVLEAMCCSCAWVRRGEFLMRLRSGVYPCVVVSNDEERSSRRCAIVIVVESDISIVDNAAVFCMWLIMIAEVKSLLGLHLPAKLQRLQFGLIFM